MLSPTFLTSHEQSVSPVSFTNTFKTVPSSYPFFSPSQHFPIVEVDYNGYGFSTCQDDMKK